MMNIIKLTLSCIGLALVLAACGKSDNGSSSTTCDAGYVWNGSTCVYGYGYGYGYNTCPTPGQVQTQYGCLPPCPGNPSLGQMANGQCVPAVTTPGYNGYPQYPQYGWPGQWGYNCRFIIDGFGRYYRYCY